MITVTLTNIQYDEELVLVESDSGFVGLTVEGHALFGGGPAGIDAAGSRKGENIVCSAVSFSALTMLKSITLIAGVKPEYNVREGFLDFRIRIKELSAETKNILRVLLESFMIGILDMKRAYPGLFAVRGVTQNK